MPLRTIVSKTYCARHQWHYLTTGRSEMCPICLAEITKQLEQTKPESDDGRKKT